MAVKAWSSYGDDVLLLLLVLPTLPFGFLGCLCQVFLLRCQKVRLELDHLNSLWVEDHRRLGGIPVIQCRGELSIWMENLIFAEGLDLLTQGQSMRGGNLLRKANQSIPAPEAAAGGGRPKSPTSTNPAALVTLVFAGTRSSLSNPQLPSLTFHLNHREGGHCQVNRRRPFAKQAL